MYEQLNGFFESTLGQLVTVGIVLLFFLMIIIPKKNEKTSARAITISALMVALSIGLGEIKVFTMPQGGSVTLLSMLPIALCGYLLGTRKAVLAGMSLGLVNLILGPYVVHPLQLLIDYPLAFGALGLSGVFQNKKNGLVKGYILAVFSRYLCSVLSGTIFFGEYAAEGFNSLTWSLWYNFTYLGVEAAITILLLSIPVVKNNLESLKNRL